MYSMMIWRLAKAMFLSFSISAAFAISTMLLMFWPSMAAAQGSNMIVTSEISTLELVPKDAAPLRKADTDANLQSSVVVQQPTVVEESEVTPKSQAVNKQDKQAKPLEPIPEQRPGGPVAVEAASFNGVMPGVTNIEQLEEAWGSPREIRVVGRQKLSLFAVEPFQRVEVATDDDKVLSIVVHLEKPFPAGAVAKQLELGNIRPVFISNELGDVLGQAFPERGVMFAFEQNHEPGRPTMKVDKIVLEPIDAEAFLLRAETNIDTHYNNTLHDLNVALKLSPKCAKAYWLRTRVLAAIGKTAEASADGQKAVELEGDNPQYRLEFARVLTQSGRLREAMKHAQVAIDTGEHRPHIKAAAQCLLGDILSMGEKPDFVGALKQHMAAIKTADPLSVDRHPAIRLAAKEVLIDAHLGAASDIAWGGWSQKDKSVERWCQRAGAFAEELIANDGGTEEHRFRVATRCLAAYVGVKGKLDPQKYAEESLQVGEVLIDLADDPAKKRQLQCDLGMAMFNAMQIAQARKDNKSAIEYGEKTAHYMEASIEQGLDNSMSNYLLGRLYFRIGAIHALAEKDHTAAIAWFDKAVPLLSRPLPDDSHSELGRHGETFVSMGVSYWSTGEKEKAVQLTEVGLELMKEAVDEGIMETASLSVPYQNLAAMQRNMGDDKSADQYERLAEKVMASDGGKKSLQR